jgi:glycosyltransferase involved in cell wall biosynthesis
MKVLFLGRLDALEVLGGDTIQMLETKAALEKLGVHVEIGKGLEPDLAGFDLVHIFNTQFPDVGLPHLRWCKRHGRPVVLSTIYWDMKAAYESKDFFRYDVQRGLLRFGRHAPRFGRKALTTIREARTRFNHKIREMLVAADALLPNSVAELEILVAEFDYPIARGKTFVVPNAIKPTPANPPLSPANAELLRSLPDRYVMEAARLESVKGQLQLLRAMAKWCPALPIVFVGGRPKGPYADAFAAELAKNVNARHLGIIPYDELPHFYARAKVHALPSLRESPGLATLEAALAGSNCVVGIHAPVQEYFGVEAWTCDPNDVDSIGKAITAAWDAPPNLRLRERLLRDFTWERAAHETLNAYQHVRSSAWRVR